MTHLINRLQFAIDCPDEAYAFNLRHNFSQTFQWQIAEVVERVCSKYIGEEEWLQIDKVEIDLGRFSPHSFDTRFAEVFLAKFETELLRKLAPIPPGQREMSRQRSKEALLRFFLQKGTLPWWADESGIDLEEISWETLRQGADAFRQFLYRNRAKTVLWQRIAWQLPASVQGPIMLLFEALREAEEKFNRWVHLIVGRNGKGVSVDPERAPEKIRRIVLEQAPDILQNTVGDAGLIRIFEVCLPKLFGTSTESVSPVMAGWDEMYEPSTKPDAQTESGAHLTPAAGRTPGVGFEPLTGDDAIEAETPEKYVVRHSGIVLLAPFLKPFFTQAGLLDGNEWKSREAAYKAVHLLKFLSTGGQRSPEYTMTLEKLFCGLALEEPVPLEVHLDEKDTEEAESLLLSVIGHWKALRNTSIVGLREAFLKRDGLITRQESGWLLQVERKTLDVLLDSIPWGYSTVRLPWNDYLIFVEW